MEKRPANKKLQTGVLIFFLALLLFPLAQKKLHLFHEKELGGFFNEQDYPEIDPSQLLTGEYQKRFETSVRDNMGFHDFLIELQCQLNYSLFNAAKVQSVIVGKEGYLYLTSYVAAVNGDDFRGSGYISMETEKAKVIQSELKKKNIDLIFALAPGKGSFYPEYIPDKLMQRANSDSTNYSCYKEALKNNGVGLIDLRAYFLSIKDTAKNAAFPKVGVHWSEYAAVMAIDTITNYIAALRNIKTRDFSISDFEKKDKIKSTDYDAAALLNTLSVVPHDELPYVNIKYGSVTNRIRPKLLAIGDSYFSCIGATHILDSVYSDWHYWLYNKALVKSKKGYDLKTAIEMNDVVLLIASDATLHEFPYGFIDEAYEIYAPKNKEYYSLKAKEFRLSISEIIANILKSKEWRKQLDKAAKEKGIAKELFYYENAAWLYYQQYPKK